MISYCDVPEHKVPLRKRQLAQRAALYVRDKLLLGPIDIEWFNECSPEGGKGAWERPHRRDGETPIVQPSDGRHLIRVRVDLDDLGVVRMVLHEGAHLAQIDSGWLGRGRAALERAAYGYQEKAATLVNRWQKMSTKIFDLEVKRVALDGEFEGMAAVYEIIDRNNDRIKRGAARKSIELEPTVPILDHHRPDAPLGVGFLSETRDGVRIHGKLELAVQRAREVRSLVQSGAVRGLSIGFTVLRHSWDRDIRDLEEISISEVSMVSRGFQAAPSALISGIKTVTMSDEELLQELIRDVKAFTRWLRYPQR